MPFRLLVGLGNPGEVYRHTRHNIGAWALIELAKALGLSWRHEAKFKAELASGTFDGLSLTLMRPQTFMNLSGEAVAPWLQFYRVPVSQILVLHDELDLASGRVAPKFGGGLNGHNGLRSLRSHLGAAAEFSRLRFGIGRPNTPQPIADYVLSQFSAAEKTHWLQFFPRLFARLPAVLRADWQKALPEII